MDADLADADHPSEADLVVLAEWLPNQRPRTAGEVLVARAFRHYLALRARLAQDSPSEPAAWGIYRRVPGGSDDLVEVTPEKPEPHDLSGDEHVRALYLAAPVAAAPTGEDDVRLAWRHARPFEPHRASPRQYPRPFYRADMGNLEGQCAECGEVLVAPVVPAAPAPTGEDDAAVADVDAVLSYFDEQRAAGADITADWVREHAEAIFALAHPARAAALAAQDGSQ